jgi:transposase-like protein
MLRGTVGLFSGLFSICCPHCKSIEFRSVGLRNSLERAFRWLLQPYRCSLCGHHFFLFRRQAPVGDPA